MKPKIKWDMAQLQRVVDKANQDLSDIQRGKKRFLTRKAKKEARAELVGRIRQAMDMQSDIGIEESREAMREAREANNVR